jgi:hypothetical protein
VTTIPVTHGLDPALCVTCQERPRWRSGTTCFACVQRRCCSRCEMRVVRDPVEGMPHAYLPRLVGKKVPPVRCPTHGRGRRRRTGLFT